MVHSLCSVFDEDRESALFEFNRAILIHEEHCFACSTSDAFGDTNVVDSELVAVMIADLDKQVNRKRYDARGAVRSKPNHLRPRQIEAGAIVAVAGYASLTHLHRF